MAGPASLADAPALAREMAKARVTRHDCVMRANPHHLLPLALAALAIIGCDGAGSADSDFEVAEASIPDLRRGLEEGRVTSRRLVELYLDRIAAYDGAGPELNTITRLNPRAGEEADALDRERAAGVVRGPLHGIPVLMKDNYDVAGMPTTGSSLALSGLMPPDDAFQVARLREAGAVIVGKTNLHELAAGITTISSLGGQSRNAYEPARNPGGSSGGTGAAVAASFAAVGWGSDTCGSIRIPAAVHNLFGLRPTKGLSSIDGILPLSHSQDTGGPLARTATDLAIALDATVGPDPADPATAVLEGRAVPDFQAALDPAALEGARIGVLADWLDDGGDGGRITEVVRAALAEMESLGAEVVDVTIPDLDSLLAGTGLIDLEFKFDLMDYLAGVPDAPVSTLEDIVEAGLHHEALDATFRRRIARTERPTNEYEEAMARRRALREAVVGFMDAEGLDALAYPTMRRETALIGAAPVGSTCSLSANTGLPALSLPAGFTEMEVPAGLELLGRALDDARLVGFGYALETAFPKRRAPLRTPPLDGGRPPGPVPVALEAPLGTVDGAFLLELPTGALSYRLALAGVEPEDALGVVLRRTPAADGEGGGVVVLRLAGPDVAEVTRRVPLTTRLMHDLLDGRLELVVHTRAGLEHRRLVPER